MKRWTGAVFVVAAWAVVTAHVGSPDVTFDGAAGPYGIRTIVRPPSVVPGLAEVIVRAASDDVDSVSIQPVFWRTGAAGSPSPDKMTRVAGQPRVYTGQLWLMARGSYSVYVHVDGRKGAGTAIVPVDSFATGRLGLSLPLGAILVVLGGLLFAGLVTIVRASSGESLVPPGEAFDPALRKRSNAITAISIPILALAVFGGARWWNSVDADYQRTMFHPPVAAATITGDSAHRTMRLVLRDTAEFRSIFVPVAPDHGKMMHLFLVGGQNMDVFAHLHPVERDSLVFVGEVPWLPAGPYRLFADVMLDNGLTLTATDTVGLPQMLGAVVPSDSDDSWASTSAVALGATGASAPLGGGYSLTMSNSSETIGARTPVDLSFTVRDPTGSVVPLRPYLGMAAHAVVIRDDQSVFVHLHPMGTVSTTAQQVFRARDAGDTTLHGRLKPGSLDARPMTGMPMSGQFTLPYEFPKPGRYRLWVQVKPAQEVLTGVFDVTVR
ncbi:MAG TPA: hypothetical protein VGQ44_16025 [Gemmatimonadaceae bacterium]|jgi:hypothetical protein|nr:hypothetical protein [Gemmatimonadaceae bacterium]